MERIIYLGDSTVTYNHIATWPQTGLSQGLLLYLKDDVFVRSFAINGRSTKSFIDQGRLAAADAYIEPGDFVFIQEVRVVVFDEAAPDSVDCKRDGNSQNQGACHASGT